jgi:3-hydroxyacyl-CoA dehydrogenase
MSAPFVLREDHDGVACLSLDSGPGNPLVPGLRAALMAALTKATQDPRIGAVLLRAAGRDFSLGLPMAEALPEPASPTPADLARAIETAGRPVVVALHGRVRGAAAELALAAHYRIAAPDLEMAFDGIALGLLPVAGAGQRLPRVVGMAAALEHLVGGGPVRARAALAEGLADRIAEGPLDREARNWAAELAAGGAPAVPVIASDRALQEAATGLAAMRAMRARLGRMEPGHLRPVREAMVDVVEGAMLLPAEIGLEVEATRSSEQRDEPVARALCHRATALANARTGGEVWPGGLPRRAHLLCSGTEAGARDAASLALGLARAGFEVDISGAVAQLQAVLAATGAGPTDRLCIGPAAAAVGAAGLLIADAADAGLAAALAVAAPGALLLTLGRPLPPDRLPASDITRPRAALRAHGPLERAGLVELVAPPGPGAVLGHLLRRAGFAVVRSEASVALSDALAVTMARTLAFLVATGTPSQAIRQALSGWGFARLPPLPDTQPPASAPAPLSYDAIVLRILAALVNEGARLLQGGAAIRPGDVDLAACLGPGFPEWRGGPLHVADGWPLVSLRRKMQEMAADVPAAALAPRAKALWEPQALMGELVKNGWSFADLEPG